ncbi:hypothetical protein B0H10DRAFT_2191940 [Mycena sp. CBHHK59/15]|nr:hypothetical protein B0H10DRAFT_2191940 [Mycena sp. CBHHK59/15]
MSDTTVSLSEMASRFFSQFLKAFKHAAVVDVTDSDVPMLPLSLVTHIRKTEVESITRELIDPGRSCIACTGAYGIGKSSVALMAIHDPSVVDTFGHRCWINCHALTDISSFLEMLAGKMGIPADFDPSADETRLDSIITAIQQIPLRRVVVLDDLDHLYSLDKLFTDAVIKALSSINSLVLMLTVVGWSPAPPPEVQWFLQVKPLSPEFAEHLFHSVFPVPRQRKELAELLEYVGGVPHYIVVLAILAYERRLQPTDLLQLLDDPKTDLLAIPIDGRRSLKESILAYTPEDRLGRDPHALHVFHVLAALPGGIPRDRLQTYVGLPTETIDSICEQLSNLSFVQTQRPGHLMLSRPVRDYALRSSTFDLQTQRAIYSQLTLLLEIPKSSLRPGKPEFLQTVRQFKDQRANLEDILFSFLDINSIVAVEAALQYLKPLCAVRPSLRLAGKVVEVAERQSDMSLLARSLQTQGEIQYRSGSLDAASLFARAEILFRSLEDDDSAVSEVECQLLQAEIYIRSGLEPHTLDGFKNAVQISSSFSSESGQRCHAYSLLRLAQFSKGDDPDTQKLFKTARSLFESLDDRYGLTHCDFYSGILGWHDTATKFQDFGDFEMAATCYRTEFMFAVPFDIEYIKVNGLRQITLDLLQGPALEQSLNSLRKALDIYDLLGQRLDVAFCQYHMAQLLPPEEAVDLYSRAIHQFNWSSFTHHRERSTLDQCYSLIEDGQHSAAVSILEVLQHHLGYCGGIFVLRCKELLVECHCRLNARRPAIQAVRSTLEVIGQLPEVNPEEARLETVKYKKLLTSLDGSADTLPSITFDESVHGDHRRFLELAAEAEEESSDEPAGSL